VIRYNPTSGFSGDLMESTFGKLLNWNSTTAQLGSMNKIVADDLAQRQNMTDAENKFHSQGTIIGTGAINILNSQQIILNDTQVTRAVGPAVYQSTWKNTAEQISNNVEYDHKDSDGVRKTTSPRTIIDPFVGIFNLITNPGAHNVSNYK
jgi:predicted secreted hydrolase